jgi:hypothetical protein
MEKFNQPINIEGGSNPEENVFDLFDGLPELAIKKTGENPHFSNFSERN